MRRPFDITNGSRPQANHESIGLTLLELLITVLILASFTIISTYIISHLIYGSKSSIKQTAVDDWGRVDYLIETDVRESLNIEVNSNSFGSCGTTISSPKLSLQTAYSSSPIVYYNSGSGTSQSIRRCGPAILKNGTLSTTINRDSLVADNASLAASLQSDSSLLKYDVTFFQINVTETGFARLRARTY